jgi:hypothetical protein
MWDWDGNPNNVWLSYTDNQRPNTISHGTDLETGEKIIENKLNKIW